MRARGVILVVALALGLVGIGPMDAAPAQAAAQLAPTPVVNGNRLVNERTGATFVPHGVNWPSFEYACTEGWGYSDGDDTQAAASAMVAWHINTVRIPLNQDCWLGKNTNYGTVAGYKAALKSWVDILNGDGIVVILDLHLTAPAGQVADGQYPMADAQSLTFWSQVAAAYATDRSVMFDAFNEPYSIWDSASESYSFQLTWDCWENGGCQAPDVENQQPSGAGTYTVVGMSALVAAIRAAGAPQPIMLGGLDYSNNLTGWLAHKPDDSQLVASWHNYQGNACDESCWNSVVAPLAAVVPVVAGEFGGQSTYMTTFMTWADAHGVGYLPWAWWDAQDLSGDDALYALYSGASFTPQAPAGTAYHAHLATLPNSNSPPLLSNASGRSPGTSPVIVRHRPDGPGPVRAAPSTVSAAARVPAEDRVAIAELSEPILLRVWR